MFFTYDNEWEKIIISNEVIDEYIIVFHKFRRTQDNTIRDNCIVKIEAIVEVIISNKDPNPKVNGKGIKKIKEAGIKIILNVLKEKGEKLNRRFFSLIKNKRPYIILKWAEPKNNFIANKKNESKLFLNTTKKTCWRHVWCSSIHI